MTGLNRVDNKMFPTTLGTVFLTFTCDIISISIYSNTITSKHTMELRTLCTDTMSRRMITNYMY